MNKACQFDAISLEIGSLPLAVPDRGLSLPTEENHENFSHQEHRPGRARSYRP